MPSVRPSQSQRTDRPLHPLPAAPWDSSPRVYIYTLPLPQSKAKQRNAKQRTNERFYLTHLPNPLIPLTHIHPSIHPYPTKPRPSPPPTTHHHHNPPPSAHSSHTLISLTHTHISFPPSNRTENDANVDHKSPPFRKQQQEQADRVKSRQCPQQQRRRHIRGDTAYVIASYAIQYITYIYIHIYQLPADLTHTPRLELSLLVKVVHPSALLAYLLVCLFACLLVCLFTTNRHSQWLFFAW